ncbi:MAG: hypothetical protein RMK30_07875 [Anaerolineae bacterium]|nr:hypothetical protein [Anaerolineae bacterium]MDW8102778.1 hypothetical protein [Anaerolineae bacterium]
MEGNHIEEGREFRSLFRYTLLGYILGLSLGALLDHMGFRGNPFSEWVVRSFSGEGESIFEGFYALTSRLMGKSLSMAEAYGWGKLAGMVSPWVVDFFSRLLGVNVYGVEGFYIPYLYALSDQIGANISGLFFLWKKRRGLGGALDEYRRNPVMLTSLAVILLVPVGLILARLMGFSPTTNLYAALETVASNLCWLPPLVGVLWERKIKKEEKL